MATRDIKPKDPLWGLAQLLADGLPPGPFERPARFWRTSAGVKLHREDCTKVGSSCLAPYLADFRTVEVSKLCTQCVDGPPDELHRVYILQAREVAQCAEALQEVIDSREGITLTQGPHAQWANPSWLDRAKVQSVANRLEDIYQAPGTHPDMLNHLEATRQTTQALLKAAQASREQGRNKVAVVRRCVLDTMANYRAGRQESVPHLSLPPRAVRRASPMASLSLTDQGGIGSGLGDMITATWRTWRLEVVHHGDVSRATDTALAEAVEILGRSEPTRLDQLSRGHVRPAASGGATPWECLVTDWRLSVESDLGELLELWGASYLKHLAKAQRAPDRIYALENFKAGMRNAQSATTSILAHLPVHIDRTRDMALVAGPAVLGNWLNLFGLNGRCGSTARSAAGQAHDVGPVPADVDLLEVFVTVGHLLPRPQLVTAESIRTALESATGVHVASAS